MGSGSHQTSSWVSEKRVLRASPVRTIASWVNGQPFGCAVVPDVYIMIAASRTRTACDASQTTLAGTEGCRASKAARSRKPSGELSPSITHARSRGVASSARAAGSAAVARPGRASRSWPTKSISGITSLVSRTTAAESAIT